MQKAKVKQWCWECLKQKLTCGTISVADQSQLETSEGLGKWKGPYFSHGYHGDWHDSLTFCVITQTFSLAGEPAEELSAAFSLSSPSQRSLVSQWCWFRGFWYRVLKWIGAMTEGTCCSLRFSFLIVLLEVYNLKQLTDWPYSKTTLMAALKQPLQWWTERQRRKLSRLEPFKLPLLPEKNAPLSHS